MKEITEEQYEAIKHLIEADDMTCYDDMIGHKFFFRAVTFHQVGKVTARVGKFLKLEQASWVADSGRFMNAIKEGTLSEVEPVGTAYVNIDSIVDFFPWNHELPTEQK